MIQVSGVPPPTITINPLFTNGAQRGAMQAVPDMVLAAIAHQQAGRAGQAAALYRDALAIEPDQPQALYLAGVLELAEGRAPEAARLLTRAVAARPGHAGAALHLARALLATHAPEPALAQAMGVLARDPAAVEAWFLLGTALAALDRPDSAEAALRQALALSPGHVSARVNLANALVDQERWDEADIAYRAALTQDPASGEAAASFGCLLTARGRLTDAIAVLQAGIAQRPGFAPMHWNLAEAALLAGDYTTGFAAYEWRRRHDRFRADFVDLPGPVWDGGGPAGRTILVHAEQGFGDTIQFARFLPEIAARGGIPVLACDPGLVGLLGAMPGVRAVARGAALPAYDFWIDQMSLPRAFATTRETIPAAAGYLTADPALLANWRARLERDEFVAAPSSHSSPLCDRAHQTPGGSASGHHGLAGFDRVIQTSGGSASGHHGLAGFDRVIQTSGGPASGHHALAGLDPHDAPRLRVGLCWAGNPAHSNDRRRSLPCGAALRSLLAPLRALPRIAWISLQAGPRAGEAALLGLPDLSRALTSYAETAALIGALDLVVAVDTSVVHLAGALGRPCFVMLPHAPDWRWLLDQPHTSPWYDSLRLFRQSAPGTWAPVIAAIACAVQNFS